MKPATVADPAAIHPYMRRLCRPHVMQYGGIRMSEMKKCTQCEAELPEDAVFCPECGTRQASPPSSDTPDSGTALGGAAVLAAGAAVAFDPFASSPGSATSAAVPQASPAATPATAPGTAPVGAAQSFQYTMPSMPPDMPPQQAYPQAAGPQQTYPQSAGPQPGQQAWTQPQPNPQQPPQPGWQGAPVGGMPATAMPPPAKASGFGKKKVKQEAGAPAGMPAAAPTSGKPAAKLPVATIVILGLTIIGLLVWFLLYNSPDLPEFAFSAATANGVVFAFLLMTILAIVGAALFRFNMRGRKLAVLGDILLVIVLLVLFYGMSVTMFKETNLFYRMFMAITGG